MLEYHATCQTWQPFSSPNLLVPQPDQWHYNPWQSETLRIIAVLQSQLIVTFRWIVAVDCGPRIIGKSCKAALLLQDSAISAVVVAITSSMAESLRIFKQSDIWSCSRLLMHPCKLVGSELAWSLPVWRKRIQNFTWPEVQLRKTKSKVGNVLPSKGQHACDSRKNNPFWKS